MGASVSMLGPGPRIGDVIGENGWGPKQSRGRYSAKCREIAFEESDFGVQYQFARSVRPAEK